jgi:hypothetical protein
MNKSKFISNLLNFIEEKEADLISWGFYDTGLKSPEIENLLKSNADSQLTEEFEKYQNEGNTIDDILADMHFENLLYLIPNKKNTYRSRFSEGMRLIANLKQRFKNEDWSSAKKLVSDVKIDLTNRKYPTFNVSPEKAWEEITKNRNFIEIQKKVFFQLSKNFEGKKINFAGFQTRSFIRILRNYNISKEELGTIISAGTGSGKTKAFYIPAFTSISADLTKPNNNFTKVISVYPRNVLLADQLREAISESLKIYDLLKSMRLRPISFGALMGDVPHNINTFETKNIKFFKNWKRLETVKGWIVPFLRAPKHPGRGELVWLDKDRKNNKTCLYRVDAINEEPEIPDGIIKLTREDIQKKPPDFLFLSLEMLHREISNPDWSVALGNNVQGKPRLLLFDEIHNYSGLSGAQTPWIIQRWKSSIFDFNGLHVVGLSATLKEGVSHLATVGGVKYDRVIECSPQEDELLVEGREYNIILKGDTSSGASLLATSIQTAMLTSRLLTPKNISYPSGLASDSIYLRKVFGFTDQLDSLNRWFTDLIDADRNKRLSRYRTKPVNTNASVLEHMENDGQLWSLPEKLGHNLNQSMVISRCSSQDPGADTSSDIIIATASLEVGYDDPNVSTVIHHKAPINMASFIQRKGRAGRIRGSRPMTVTILSDYGKDRWFFQNADKLFNPEIDKISIPIFNPYVVKVQATSFLIDWIGRRIKKNRPYSYLKYSQGYNNTERFKCINLLNKVLNKEDGFYDVFRKNLSYALPLPSNSNYFSEEEKNRIIDEILWHSPRPLMKEVIPTLLRQLESNWKFYKNVNELGIEDEKTKQPLPKFIPSSTFSDLNLSEVEINFPEKPNKERQTRGLMSQIFETCPGRVSKRYSDNTNDLGFWLKGSEKLLQDGDHQNLNFNDFFPNSFLINNVNGLNIKQPMSIDLYERPKEVKDSSNANWIWKNQITYHGDGNKFRLFVNKDWKNIFYETKVFLHSEQNSLKIMRYSTGGYYNILHGANNERQGSFSFKDNNQMEYAVGYEQIVDGFTVKIKKETLKENNNIDFSSDCLARLRQDFFKYKLITSNVLNENANFFTIEWIYKTCLAMLTATALKNKTDLLNAQSLLSNQREISTKKVLDTMFNANEIISENFNNEIDGLDTKLEKRLINIWKNKVLSDEIINLEKILWNDLNDEFYDWVNQKFLVTVSESILKSFFSILEDVNDDEVIVDIKEYDDEFHIVLSETSPGGIGYIDHFIKLISNNETLFEKGFNNALDFCPKHETSKELIKILELSTNSDAEEVFQKVRTANSYAEAVYAKQNLIKVIGDFGCQNNRTIIIPLIYRLLQNLFQNKLLNGKISDKWTKSINNFWRKKERELSIPIDERVFIYFCLTNNSIKKKLLLWIKNITNVNPSNSQLFSIIEGFLLSFCYETCPQCIRNSNRFSSNISPSRQLASEIIKKYFNPVDIINIENGWEDQLRKLFEKTNVVEIVVKENQFNDVAQTVRLLLNEPIYKEYLLVWPILESVKKRNEEVILQLKMRNVESM